GVLYVGFRQASDQTMTKREALFIGNERYGAAPLEHALEHGYLTALPLERRTEAGTSSSTRTWRKRPIAGEPGSPSCGFAPTPRATPTKMRASSIACTDCSSSCVHVTGC